MSQDFVLTIEGLEEWRRWLESVEKEKIKEMKSRVLRTVGLRTMEYLHDYTPGASGDLSGSFQMGGSGNVFEMRVGRHSHVVVGTNIAYARYVNDGYTQKAGRFVPGEWRSNVFHYIPGHDEGMVLTGAVIQGAHMFEKAVDLVAGDVDTIAEFEFQRMYASLRGGI